MLSSSSHSADPSPSGAESPELMRRRFVEALRRAEIIALVNAAGSEVELARALTEELCEVYDSEIGLLVSFGARPADDRVIGATGIDLDGRPPLAPELRDQARDAERALPLTGVAIAGVPTARAIFLSQAAGRDSRIGLVVARLYDGDFDPPEVALLEAISASVAHALERLWARDEVEEASLAIAAALANAMEAHDVDTAGHAQEIAQLAVGVGERLGLAGDELRDLRLGAIFHDIGKIAIGAELLRKPGPLTPEERREVERHVVVGEQILAPVPFLREVRRLVRHSHERWDGGGYPDGLAAERIPLGARIISVVDAWHAMTSDRPYQAAIPEPEAIAELERNSGSQFDPRAVAAFLATRG